MGKPQIPDETAVTGWLRSAGCGGGKRVEVNEQPDRVQVRDSKDPNGPVLVFTTAEWQAFTAGIKADEMSAHRATSKRIRAAVIELLRREIQHCGHGREGHLNGADLALIVEALTPGDGRAADRFAELERAAREAVDE